MSQSELVRPENGAYFDAPEAHEHGPDDSHGHGHGHTSEPADAFGDRLDDYTGRHRQPDSDTAHDHDHAPHHEPDPADMYGRHARLETPPAAGRFAQLNETHLLGLARQARKANHLFDASYGTPTPDIADIERKYGLQSIRERLGEAYPELNPHQHAAVAKAYENSYARLLSSHTAAAAKHAHRHAGSEADCSHTHGPIKQFIENSQNNLLGKIKNDKVRQVAGILMRGSSLVFICPGDDIAITGLNIYGSISGHGDSEHQDPVAIMPGQPRLQELPRPGIITAKVPLLESQPEPKGPSMWQRMKDKLADTGQELGVRGRTRARAALVGAVACTGILAGVVGAQGGATAERPETPVAVPQQEAFKPSPVPRQEPLVHIEQVETGDTQWGMTKQAIAEAGLDSGDTRLVNAATHANMELNATTNPDGDKIYPSQKLKQLGGNALKLLAGSIR